MVVKRVASRTVTNATRRAVATLARNHIIPQRVILVVVARNGVDRFVDSSVHLKAYIFHVENHLAPHLFISPVECHLIDASIITVRCFRVIVHFARFGLKKAQRQNKHGMNHLLRNYGDGSDEPALYGGASDEPAQMVIHSAHKAIIYRCRAIAVRGRRKGKRCGASASRRTRGRKRGST